MRLPYIQEQAEDPGVNQDRVETSWKRLLKESMNDDKENIERWKAELDNLLVFVSTTICHYTRSLGSKSVLGCSVFGGGDSICRTVILVPTPRPKYAIYGHPLADLPTAVVIRDRWPLR